MSERTSRPTLEELATHVGGELRGEASVFVQGINAIADARADEITFVSRGTYARQWSESKAAAAVVSRSAAAAMPEDDPRPLIIVPDAEIASIQLLELFAPPSDLPDAGIAPTATVHATAQIADDVRIAAYVSVGAGVKLAEGVVLHPGVHLYPGVEVGAGSVLHANVVVRERCRIGRGVIIHQNTSIGADGFGYRPDPAGGGLLKVPHIGNVVIEDQVEVGANTCVDRGKFGSTVIGAGTKIDNLCQIGHNVRIGRSCILAGGILVAGSVRIGDGVLIAGGAGIRDHVSIGSGARIGASTIVLKDMPAGATWLGCPAEDANAVKRQWASLRHLPELVRDWQREKRGSTADRGAE